MLNEMGTRLKEARIAKGYSLEDLQDVTKIQKRYLAGIEEGNYSMMPGQFYVRAFIKQYADAVGLNADELLEQHKSEMPETTKEQVSKPMAAPARSRRQSMSKSSSGRINEKMPMIIVALFIVLIIFVMWFFYNMLAENDPTDEATENDDGLQYEAPSENSPPPTEEEEPAEDEAAEEQPEEEPAEPETEISVAGTEGQTTTYQWTGPAERELVIDVSGPSWVGATDENGENLMTAATMQAGQSETLDVSEASQIRLRLGAAPNVELSLNGEPIEYQQDLTTQNIVIDFTDAE
ncbi:helix-turn-helix domain-containing protein [Planomicrobium okeanokoites]|uniref:helix-turn-helix domain-containing protein n=1 Tax=Planomicrobium okeanokoites TaxID=244 RepID=UPI002491A6B9|nr:helix-turn-helix domain-containing protein [Planomicrobium okeanokoites]